MAGSIGDIGDLVAVAFAISIGFDFIQNSANAFDHAKIGDFLSPHLPGRFHPGCHFERQNKWPRGGLPHATNPGYSDRHHKWVTLCLEMALMTMRGISFSGNW